MATTPASDSQPKVVRISRFQIGLNVLIQLLVFTGIVLMLNYISFRHFKRWDFSRDQKYALSSQTKSLLTSLKKPVKAVIFFSSAAEIAPDVTGLLREYEFASDKKFNTEIVEPYRNLTRATELQAKYKFGANENILILDFDGRSKFVNAADMAEFEQPDQMSMMMGQAQPKLKAFKGEAAITSALLELTEGKPNKVYFVSGHGEPDLKSPDLTIFNESLKRQNIEAAPLNLLNAEIPEDARSVIISGPKYDLSELEVKRLGDFWEKNGRIFIFLNPFAKTTRLNQWLSRQGVVPQDDRVIRTGTFLSMDGGGAPQLKEGAISQAAFIVAESGTDITKDMAGASKQLLGSTESLFLDRTKEKIDRIRLMPLMESAEGFWGETDNTGGEDSTPTKDPSKDHIGPLTLAVAAEKGAVADSRVKVETSRMIVAGNSEMLNNNAYRLAEGLTIDLAMNGLNWLLDRDELIGIAPKEKNKIALSVSDAQLRNIALALMGAVPGVVAVFGLLNWWQRRS